MSKKLIFILCLIIGAGILSCLYFASGKTSSAQTTIQFASWGSESEIKILKPILADFEKENPQIGSSYLRISIYKLQVGCLINLCGNTATITGANILLNL